jgi:glycosyltransferase involved in cell wall biosynthesis|tara:strand:- start:1493 stop:2200 length:708 start_codon:yes stop_codon:yes gene_type:complete
MKTLSIIIPLYNKEKGISNTLNLIETKCSEMKISYEILIIENESTDNSFDIANNYVKNKDNISLFRSNKGLGNALKEGVAIAKNDYVAFIPADFTFGKSELEYFSRENSQLSEYIIGSRALEGSFSESSFDRKIITVGFNLLKKIILNLNIKDSMGTFIIETNLAKRLCAESFADQFFITTELIFRAMKEGIQIKEIPIINRVDDTNQTTVRYFYDSFDAFIDLLKLRKLEGRLK